MVIIRTTLRRQGLVPYSSMFVIIVVLILVTFTLVQETAVCFNVVSQPRRHHPSKRLAVAATPAAPLTTTAIHAYALTTALESLWEDRLKDELDDDREFYEHLTWIDDLQQDNNGENDDGEEANDQHRILPLYPLPAVYVPTPGINHTLVNIEPQNVKMALDLLNVKKKQDRQFCVVLRAVDSGRIASVGTIMTMLDADIQLHYHAAAAARRQYASDHNNDSDDNDEEGATTTDQVIEDILKNKINIDDIARIRVTCSADSLVEITNVLNTDAFSPTNRIIYKSDEYLRAKVRPLNNVVMTTKDNDDSGSGVDSLGSDAATSDLPESLLSDLITEMNSVIRDYSTIRTVYQLELGSEDFPPGWLAELGNNMPTMGNITTDSLDYPPTETSTCTPASAFEQQFWSFVQEWLSVCLTLRQGLHAVLSTERNELMIEAASAKGGPLKLPIHIEDLDPRARLEIQQLEVDGQEKYLEMGMDPVLDFQVLVSQLTWPLRVRWLKTIVERERIRLEGIASRY